MSIEQNYNIRFVAKLALKEKQIQQNYRPIIAVHKWFARRPGTLFRALLLSEYAGKPVDESYYRTHDLAGLTIADPFMGGGIPLLEANRIGCDVIGTDINPMAAWIVREEVDAIDLAAYAKQATALLDQLRARVGPFYKTRCPLTGRPDAEVKYFLWVKTGTCANCRNAFDLFPGYVLAENARHTSYVLVCAGCGALNDVESPDRPGHCACGTPLRTEGPVRRNKCTCPHCGEMNAGPFHGDGPPTHRLFAIEYYNSDLKDRPGRLFKKPDQDDLARVATVESEWRTERPRFVPDDVIPAGDESSRLHRWGYQRFRELFNARQLLGLETSARIIAAVEDVRLRRALATNLSDLLRYQNMLCRYDTMALKSLDIFSIHGFPVGYVQVESNLLGLRNENGTPVGSGSWVNIVEKYSKAKRYCITPFELEISGHKKTTRVIDGEWIGERNPAHPAARTRRVDIRCVPATALTLKPSSLDGVFTDPPYYGMVQYGELMHFCYVWLRRIMGEALPGLERDSTRHEQELTGNFTAERNLEHFAEGLAAVFADMALALRSGAPLVFTYHHNSQGPYLAAGVAILDAGLTCSASLPCPAEMGGSIHIHGTRSSIIDTVFVCRDRGSTSRTLLFQDDEGLAHILNGELAELQGADVRPTPGDVRCMTLGHITRMAIWTLRGTWDQTLPTAAKLATFQRAMDSLATVDGAARCLKGLGPIRPTITGSLFSRADEKDLADAVAF